MKLLFILIAFLFTSERALVSTDTMRGPKPRKATIYATAANSNQRLSTAAIQLFETCGQPLETEIAVFVNDDKTFQTFMGIGGSATDAAAEVFSKLPPLKQEELLKAYYDPKTGNAYSLLRTTIHSSDFSSESYTYVNEGDTSLASFSIAHDQQHKIPFIKRIRAMAGKDMILYASPWSPPAFMKSNKSMLKGGKLLPEFNASWAMYYTKFIKAYEAAGIPIWGITVQNEPMATQTWESCIYTAEEERDFLKNHLGPTMKREGLGDKKIIVWDHNRDLINHRADVILSDPQAAAYVWGIGFHWYETWTGGNPMFDNVAQVHASYPDKHLIFTEGCNEKFDATRYQYWPNAERYGRSMINDFNAGTVAWTDWNLLLDETGGPNHVKNLCFAPIHADTRTGELIITPSYYYIGHFSRFIKPGAVRISSVASRSALLTTSFKNPDGTIVTVVMNDSDEAVKFKLMIDGTAIESTVPVDGIQTIVY
jgi:glucosylceramidase